jgi:hypothetical protein
MLTEYHSLVAVVVLVSRAVFVTFNRSPKRNGLSRYSATCNWTSRILCNHLAIELIPDLTTPKQMDSSVGTKYSFMDWTLEIYIDWFADDNSKAVSR